MKVILKHCFIAAFFFSLGLNISGLVVSDESRTDILMEPQTPASAVQDVGHLTEVLKSGLEEIRVVLEMQRKDQIIMEEKLHNLLALSAPTHYEEEIVPADRKYMSESERIAMSQEEFESLQVSVEDQVFSGYWTIENAAALMKSSSKMSHEQRASLQLKVVQAINDGVLEPENLYHPLF